MRRILSYVLAMSLTASFIAPLTALAVSHIAPDPNDYQVNGGDGSSIWMEVSRYAENKGEVVNGLRAPTSKVTIYSRIPNPVVRIINPDFCSGRAPDSVGSYSNSGNHTLYSFSGGTPTSWGGSPSRYGKWSNDPGCVNTVWDVQLNNLTPVNELGLEGYYKSILTADIAVTLGQVNAFKVELKDSSIGFVSFTSLSNSQFALQRRDSVDKTATFNIMFATPCTVAPHGEIGSLEWFDADQGSYDQEPSNYGFRIWQRSRGANDAWEHLPSLDTNTKEDLGGNDAYRKKSFTAMPDKEYRWEWYGVAKRNGIQFKVPYDSVYSKVSCPPASYGATPILPQDSANITEPGSKVSVTPRITVVDNKTRDLAWDLVTFVLSPGKDPKGSEKNDSNACSYHSYGYASEPCESLANGSGAYSVGVSQELDQVSSKKTIETGNYEVGSKICFSLAINKYDQDAGEDNWYHSVPVCYLVAKRPTAQVWGGDVRVGSDYDEFVSKTSNIIAPSRTIGGKIYGSWGEYALMAPSSSFIYSASGGSLSGAGVDSAAISNLLGYNPLTFTNTATQTGKPGYMGWGSLQGNIPSVASYYFSRVAGGNSSNNVNISTLPDSTYSMHRPSSGSLNISGDNNGKSLVLYVDGNAYIKDNIILSDNLTGNKISQTVIIANNIIIDRKVTRVDAWLVARPREGLDKTGIVATCIDDDSAKKKYTEVNRYYEGLDSKTCNQQLQINGPIIAKELWMRRTSGSETSNLHVPAEIMNFRPDAYLWALQESRNSGAISTNMTYELPPRF